MTAKEFVKDKMPMARAERHKRRFDNPYWLIRDGRSSMWFAQGNSESNAWVNAKKILIDREP